MKRALLLHGTDGNSTVNWLPWLKNELEVAGWEVWVPDLPDAHTPNIMRYNEYIHTNTEWLFDNDTVIIGHSSGAVASLGLLESLPSSDVVKRTILIGAFNDDLGWDTLSGLFEHPLDFGLIKTRSKSFTLIHSNDDPYCPLDHAKTLAKELDGELLILEGQKHFSTETDESYVTFPYLRSLLVNDGTNVHSSRHEIR